MGAWWTRVLLLAVAGGISLAMALPQSLAPARDAPVPAGPAPATALSSAVEFDDDVASDPAPEPSNVPPAAADDCRALLRAPGGVMPWNATGPKKVGLQAGHWLTQEAPDELQRLRSQTGTSSGGYTERQVNLDIARRTAALLTELGVEAEVLPTTVPPCYRAHVFVAIHADGDVTGVLRGFKVARASASAIPAVDDALVTALNEEYANATGLRRDDEHISRRMLNYYAFNYRRQRHAIAPSTPAAIIETGFLTNAADRAFLTERPDRVAAGIANGILKFLGITERVPLP